MKYKGI